MQHHLPNYVTVTWFAQRKKVFPYEVYICIDQGLIPAVLVGKEKLLLLDYEHCQYYRFPRYKGNKEAKDQYKEALREYFTSTLPKTGNVPLVSRMALLPSIGSAIDMDLYLYPQKADGTVDLYWGTKNHITDLEEDWGNDLSPLDRDTVEYLKQAAAYRRKHTINHK